MSQLPQILRRMTVLRVEGSFWEIRGIAWWEASRAQKKQRPAKS